MLPAPDYFLLAGSTCVPLSYWSPPHCTGLLLATHISNYLPLSHPHSAAVSTFFHAWRRRYCIMVIKHVQGGRDFVPRSSSAIVNLALALVIATHTSCRSARVVLHHNSERVACGLRFSQSYIQYYCFTNLYSGTIRGPHTILYYTLYSMYSLRLGGRSAARANMLNTTLRLHVLRDGAESAVPSSTTVPDVAAAPTYVYSRLTYPRHLFPSFYRDFNLYSSGGALPPTSPLR